ncbi:NTP transferase domain-containing protein [Thalassobacillus sp. C254]|uniref:NTP transferase domain-containing protein n=1 Tax=Thalassobacillus sp. C254 TaxID=1225341 RepID=UPI0006D129C0|nr:NTP transferase domain-containing protein [Thalassobacillus sp. C254]
MKPKVIGILLAGGKSRRMGENKLALFLGQLSIGSLSLKTALDSSLDHILVVTDEKDQLEWVDPLLFSPFYRSRWTQVKAKQTDLGQAYSLRAGLNKAETEEVYGAVVLLGDQPFYLYRF